MKRLVLFLFCTVSLFGALPPLAQNLNELQSLLSDPELYTLLGSSEPIQAVLRTDTGYVVMTRSSFLRVDCEYLSLERPGPRPFRFHFYPSIGFDENR